ncbi:hypothetical protein [Anaerotignum sp.]|uniref:hypothetical protein n=1 Tax=Anaerotignum sp. TaxID=2039241 RepID=UPI0027152A9C|nr:hypothetical protein [Anaerotignum sp.]
MKNRIKFAVFIILIAMVFTAGCTAKSTSNNKTTEEGATGNYIVLAKSKLEASSSFESDFYAEVQIGENPKTVTNAKVQMVYEPLALKIKTQDLYAQSTIDSETYLEKVDAGVNMYMAYDGEWTEMTLDEKNAMKSLGMYDAGKGMGLLLASVENWAETSEKSGIVTITGDIPAEKVYDISEAGSFLQLAGMNGVDQSYYSGVEAVPVEIQLKEDGTPISFTVDFTKTLETVMNHVLQALAQDDVETISVQKYLIKQNILSLNEIKKIEIPIAARGAINYEKEISLLENSTDEQ